MPGSSRISATNVGVCAHELACPCICDGCSGEKKKNEKIFKNGIFFHGASVLIPPYCWLTERYTDSTAEVDSAVLAG